ncbi:hypothetical protein FA95DRAFT_1457206, partial [Auriscalpium vulgare]
VEEAIFVTRGLLMDKDLPPITDKSQLNGRPLMAKQTVSLAGLESPLFNSALGAILAVHGQMSSLFAEGELQEWLPSRDDDQVTLELSNRYVTRKEYAQGQLSVPFLRGVDPSGVIHDETSREGVHTTDNQVSYYERLTTAGDGFEYKEVEPAVFRIGQIVEVQFALGSVPLAGR